MLACNWAATQTVRVRAATVGDDRGEAGRVCLGFIKFCARAKFGRADEAGRAAKCAASGAFAAKVDDALAPAKPLTLKDVRGKRPAEAAEQRPTGKPRGQSRAWRAP